MSVRLLGLALLLACADIESPAPALPDVIATLRVALGANSSDRKIDSLQVRVLDSSRTVLPNTRSDCVHLVVPIPVSIHYKVFIPGGQGTATMSWRADSGRANVWATAAWSNATILLAQYMVVRAPCDTIAGIANE